MKIITDSSKTLAICLFVLLFLSKDYCFAQNCPPSPKRIRLVDLNDFIRRQFTDQTVVNLIRCNGLVFTPNEMMITNLRKKGAYPKTAEELKARVPIYIRVDGASAPLTKRSNMSLQVDGEILLKFLNVSVTQKQRAKNILGPLAVIARPT